jgi:predicted hydrocarbon binding protein
MDDRNLPLPPEAVDVAVQTVRELIGESGAAGILQRANMLDYLKDGKLAPGKKPTFGDVGRVTQAMIDMYGTKSASATLKRAGRVQFTKWRENYPAAIGLASAALKTLPADIRMKTMFKAVGMAAKQIAHVDTEFFENPDGSLTFKAYQCPYCSGVQTAIPFCHTAVGALDELAIWVTNSPWQTEEIECRAMGAEACTFVLRPSGG